MKLIDVHTHLDHKQFEKDLDRVIKNAEMAGVKCIITSGVNSSTNREILKIAERYPVVRVSFGIYPLDALAKELETGEAEGFPRDTEAFDLDSELRWIEKNKDKCVAIGECGLDYNWVTGREDEQKAIFQKVIELSKKINKPLILHTRKAELDVVEMLEKNNVKKCVLHCFMGRKHLIKRAVDNGWSFSVPPIITRLQHFQTLVEMVPLNQLLTETDAPYLSPKAGERNEPANVAVTIKEIARIKKLSEKEVAEQIWQNSEAIFGLHY